MLDAMTGRTKDRLKLVATAVAILVGTVALAAIAQTQFGARDGFATVGRLALGLIVLASLWPAVRRLFAR